MGLELPFKEKVAPPPLVLPLLLYCCWFHWIFGLRFRSTIGGKLRDDARGNVDGDVDEVKFGVGLLKEGGKGDG
jgi:hypothetical protein